MRRLLRFHQVDWWLIAAITVLSLISLVILFSLNEAGGGLSLGRFQKQSVYVLLALVIMGVFSQVSYRQGLQYGYVLYITAAVLLVAVLIFGTNVRGTTGWFQFAGVSLQPVEFAKILFLLAMTRFLSDHGQTMHQWKTLAIYGALTLGLVALVLRQPDLGSASVILMMAFFMGLTSSVRWQQVALFIGAGIVIAMISWLFLLSGQQKDRILTFIDPAHAPLSSGYNVTQAIISVGSGQWFGRGLGRGTQSQLQFLPERETDFIFAVIGEELGLIGTLTVVILLFFIMWRIGRNAQRSSDLAVRYYGVGLVGLLFTHTLINIGMNIGVMPVTGIPLPFISAGGSSLLALAAAVGIYLNAVATSTR